MEEKTINSIAPDEPKKIINNRTIRFSDAPWYNPGVKVIIGGAGGIGSWLSLLLSRQECEIYLFDHDIIEEVNMAGQMYKTNQIGLSKVNAMANNIMDYSANSINIFDMYNETSFSNEYVFSGFDNMKARKIMLNNWEKYMATHDKPGIFIDGRLLAEEIQIYAVTRDRISEYRKFLWDDKDIADLPCSFKSTTHCGTIIAGLMTSIFNNYLTNIKFELEVREVPFKTTFELPTLTFNTRENE